MAQTSGASIRCNNTQISLESLILLFKLLSHRLVCNHRCSFQQHNKAKNKRFHHRNKVNLILLLYPSSRTTTMAMSEADNAMLSYGFK